MYVWDCSGYYLYLPAIFLYQDISTYQFYLAVNDKYVLTRGDNEYGLHKQPTGKMLNKYPVGTAVFELPFFLLAQVYGNNNDVYPADGYSLPYQIGTIFAYIFWTAFGLFVLRAFLKKYYNDTVVAFVLLCIALGTNLFYYTTFGAGMSHPFSFFLVACVLLLTDKWYTHQRAIHLYFLGAVLGWVIITRVINFAVIFIPLFWNIYDMKTLRARAKLLRNQWHRLAIATMCFLLVASIQMIYWKYTTNHWIYYSYEGEGFNFLKPAIWRGLFSYQKGWFVYTPIAFVAFLGFYSLWKQHKQLAPVLLLTMVVFIYLVFTWQQWWYGGGFGCRPLIETLPIIAVPMAALFTTVFKRTLFAKLPFIIVTVFFILLNIFQTYQYDKVIIHWDKMTRKYYWAVFGRTTINHEKVDKYLMSDAEYWQQMDERSK